MAYEAPRIVEAGKLSSTTLGSQFTLKNEDSIWSWGTTPSSR